MEYVKYMKRKGSVYLYIIGVLVALILSNCANIRKYEFICQNTVSIFLLNNGKNYYFNIPVQYMGDYQIENFEFKNGYILIGDYKILLNRDDINITVFVNKNSEDIQTFADYINSGNDIESISEYFRKETYEELFNLIYLEKNGKILISKMNEPLTREQKSDNTMPLYNIFIERILNNDEIKNIVYEYEKGSVFSRFEIWYDIIIDNEQQMKNGMVDDFELKINY